MSQIDETKIDKTAINFIKTNKEGDDLKVIQEEYKNSIIYVESNNEKNIYIGSKRVTDNYNPNIDDSIITNEVGGIVSGTKISDLKDKSISEILDIILFGSNDNLKFNGVVVVDKIENLTDGSLKNIYQGMLVSVIEENSLYALFENKWIKVGVNIEDIEEKIEISRKLSKPLVVAGLPDDSIGANIQNGSVYGTDKTIEDVLRDLLCKEIYPNVSLTTKNPIITFGGTNGVSASNYSKIMKIGSVLNLNAVTLQGISVSECSRVGSGFNYGYSTNNDNSKDGDNNPLKIYGSYDLIGNYTLTEKYSGTKEEGQGHERTSIQSTNHTDVKFDEGSFIIGLGENKITVTATSPSGEYSHPEYPEYYIVSNLGNTHDDKKLLKSNAVDGNMDYKQVVTSISVTGVYPVYVNIVSGSFVDEPIEMELSDSNTFEFKVPSEVVSQKHFTFDYPSTHNCISFKIKDLMGNFVDYKSTYEIKELNDKVVENVKYNRLTTTGNFQGEGTYKITLSKRLDVE